MSAAATGASAPAPRFPVDVNAAIGGFPWRHVPHPEPAVLARVIAREGYGAAWVGHLPSAFWRDPAPGNTELYDALAPFPTLRPAPAVRPDWPRWEHEVREAADRGAAALRAYPQLWGLGAGDPRLDRLLAAAGEAGLPLVLVTRFEDLRQRHPLDTAPDLSAAHVRALARAGARTPIVVLNAGRDFIEEVAWALTPDEVARLFFDFSWIWGPPDDHLATLLRTLGPARFVAGSGWPLRLTQNTASLLDLLPDDVAEPALTGGDAIAAAAGALSGRVR